MNKKIIISLCVIGAIAAIAVGGTMAYFSDTETSTGNTFTAGTLNLQVSDVDPLVDKFTVTDVKPGDSGNKDWVLKNTGSIAGSLDITFSALVDNENTVWESEGADNADSGELADNLDVLIYIDENDNNAYDAGTDKLVFNEKAVNIVGEKLSNYAMAAGYNKSIRLEWDVDTTVGNDIQSDIAGFDIEFQLLQVAD
jgi:spore coat-associated protein N